MHFAANTLDLDYFTVRPASVGTRVRIGSSRAEALRRLTKKRNAVGKVPGDTQGESPSPSQVTAPTMVGADSSFFFLNSFYMTFNKASIYEQHNTPNNIT